MTEQAVPMPDDSEAGADSSGKSSRAAQLERIQAFSETIKKLRKSAIEARAASGIETQWKEDEEFYEAIDDTNRDTVSQVKPYDFGGTGSGPTKKPAGMKTKSSIFVPMTRPYVDMAAARIADMYLPTDDRNWDGEPTPIPDLIKALDNHAPIMGQDGQPVMRPNAPAPQMMGGQAMLDANGQPMMQPASAPVTVSTLAQQKIDAADDAWEKARTQIDDWLTECGYNAELRRTIKSLTKLGTGIIKGPFPYRKTSKAVTHTPQGFAIEIVDEVLPGSKNVDVWRLFPDPACGEYIKNGSFVFEQDFMTRSKLRDLDGADGYIDEQIAACLEEGPISSVTGVKKVVSEADRKETDLFEIWYFEGEVEWDDIDAAGCACEGQSGDVFHCTVTMVNERVVKIALSTLDSGEFTYDVIVWQKKAGHWAGDGVARQCRTAQRGLNAAARNLMDNAGRSSRPYQVIHRGSIDPGPDEFTFYAKGDAEIQDVRQAMQFFVMPSLQEQLMGIIQYFMKMFEDATGMPMLLQGQLGNAPDTVGGMEMLQNNAGVVPREIIRTIDDNLAEPHINRYYEYLLIHGEDDAAKGDFTIKPRGSSALMERAMADQFLLQIGNLVTNPAYGLDPELYVEELLKSKRINPQRLKLSDEKKREMAQRPPPEDPRITAAKIMATATIQKAQGDNATDLKVEQANLTVEQQENAKDRQITLLTLQSEEHTQAMKDAGVSEQTINQLKTELAETSMKLNTQVQLNAVNNAHEADLAVAEHTVDIHKHNHPTQVLTPPTEPPGRAPDGEAFEK